MRSIGRWRRTLAVGVVASMALVGCGGDDGDTGDDTGSESMDDDSMDDESMDDDAMDDESMDDDAMDESMGDVATDVGVTDEPCPDTPNQDNGCIYLGQISDLSVGPFAPLAVPITDAINAFWASVNDDGGIAGYDIDSTSFVEDAEYNPQKHAESYERIRGEVAAIAQSLGTAQTLAVIDAMDSDDMVGIPMTWWSGWASNELIAQTGSNYCVDGMNGVDFVLEQGTELESVAVVKFPGDYGEDWDVGVAAGAEANGIEVVASIQQVPVSAGGDVAAAVGEIIQSGASAAFLATGPTELAQIAGGLAQGGFQGRIIGALPTFNPALLETAAGPVLEAAYTVIGPYESYSGDTPAHEAMRAAFPEPPSDGVTIGWIQSYALKSILEAAAESGDLTRAGIRAAAGSAEADYQGATPNISFGDSPAEQTPTASYISNVDTAAPTGLSTTEAEYRGSTAEGFDFSTPCFEGA